MARGWQPDFRKPLNGHRLTTEPGEAIMNKKLLYALILIVLAVIVLIFNRGRVRVDLLFTTVNALKSVVFLVFACIGVIIGVLLK